MTSRFSVPGSSKVIELRIVAPYDVAADADPSEIERAATSAGIAALVERMQESVELARWHREMVRQWSTVREPRDDQQSRGWRPADDALASDDLDGRP